MFRIGKSEIEANSDGVDFSGPFFELAHTAGLMTREGALDTSSAGYEAGLKAVFAQTDTAIEHLRLVTEGGTIQMLGRLDYAERVGKSPRWPLEAKVIGA